MKNNGQQSTKIDLSRFRFGFKSCLETETETRRVGLTALRVIPLTKAQGVQGVQGVYLVRIYILLHILEYPS